MLPLIDRDVSPPPCRGGAGGVSGCLAVLLYMLTAVMYADTVVCVVRGAQRKTPSVESVNRISELAGS